MPVERWYPVGGNYCRDLVPRQAWDRVALAGQVIPAKSEIPQAAAAYRIDHKNAAGKDGGRPTVHGFEGRPLDIVVRPQTKEQADAVERMLLLYAPRRGGTPTPVKIQAQQIAHLDITDVLITEVTGWRRHEGVLELVVKALVWVGASRKKKNATKTPTRSVDNARRAADEAKQKSNPSPSEAGSICRPPSTFPQQQG
jgi:hypothetical protein